MSRQTSEGVNSRGLWIILGLAFLVRVVCWLLATAHPERFMTDDSSGYLLMARNLYAGYFDPQSPAFFTGLIRTPGYPVFLGVLLVLCHDSFASLIAIQIAISVFTIWLTCVLATSLVGNRAALAAGLVLALDPASVLFSCLFQPETLFTALLVGGSICWLLALERGALRLAMCAGLILGLATLTRPIGLFLPLCLAPAAWLHRSARPKTALALGFLLASSVPVGVWMAKNWCLTGFAVLTIGADSSLLDYRAAGALAEDEGISHEEARALIWGRLWAMTPPPANAAEMGLRQRTLALQVLAEHPIGAAKMMFHAVLRMMAGTGLTALSNLTGDPDPEGVSRPWKRAVQGAALLALAIVYLAVARGVVRLAARRDFLTLALTLGVVAYLALLSAGPEANTRFRFPASPYLAILAGLGLSQSFGRSRPA